MKYRERNWKKQFLAAALAVSAAFTAPAMTVEAAEHVTEGVEALKQDDVVLSNTQNSVQGENQAVTAGQSSQQSQKSTDASKTVVAGGGGKKGSTGPSIMTSLSTVAELGLQPEAMLGGATITMLNSQSSSQILSVLIQTSQGKLIVIDGGLGVDGDYLRSQIMARGGHVSAWLLTHPHGDHVGALYKILQDGAQGMQIDGIYYSFASPEWYEIHDPAEKTMAISLIGTFAGLSQNVLHQVSKGQFIQVDDVIIQVMNDRYELSADKGNNATIVYKAWINGKSALFLGDMGEAGGNRLLAELGAEGLKSDIVQMAHHGQGGVGENVYRAINPSVCLWPSPDWLWNNVGDKYPIPATKSWLSKLGTQLHYCMKDGDQVIR